MPKGNISPSFSHSIGIDAIGRYAFQRDAYIIFTADAGTRQLHYFHAYRARARQEH